MSVRRDPLVSLQDVAKAAGYIADHINGPDEETFLADLKTRQAVERCFINIGEGFNRLERNAVGFRNILAHDYDDVELETIWDAALHNAPILKRTVESLISELEKAAAATGKNR